MSNNAEFLWGELVYGVGSAAQEAAKKFSIENADELACFLMERISFHCGGSIIYIPKGQRTVKNARNNLIIKEFNGVNHTYLARKYGVSVQCIYKILRDRNKGKKNATN